MVFFVLGLHLAVLFALTSQLHPDVLKAVAHAVPVAFGLTLIVINRAAGYATVGSGVSFLLAGFLPNLPVMEFAAVAAFGAMTAIAWTSWRSRHA